MEKIKACLQALQIGEHDETLIRNTIKYLKQCGLQELSDHRMLIASVYCRLLQYCQECYSEKVPEPLVQELLDVFDNIEQVIAEPEMQEREDSSLITIWFLHELKIHRKRGKTWDTEDELFRQSIEILLTELDSIHFIFEIQINGDYAFPVRELIAKVVAKPEFISSSTPLSSYHIHVLQLAVRLFEKQIDEQETLQKLLKDCNLQFINFFYSYCFMIDTRELLNYQKNGVMIFFNPDNRTVLIRHESEEYFRNKPVCKSGMLCVEQEKDYRGNTIGAFVEYTLEPGDEPTDYSEILKTEQGREEFLKLVFDRGCFNVLMERMIIKKLDGSCLPINPYCTGDETIVKGWQSDRNGRCYRKAELPDALRKYRNATLRTDGTFVMNRVSFGLALLLLMQENTGVDSLGLGTLSENCWYQSQVMGHWAEQCVDRLDALRFLTEQWFQETEYFRNRKMSGRKSGEENMEEHIIGALDFYPLRSDSGWIYRLMDCDEPEGWHVLRGELMEEEEGAEDGFLQIDLQRKNPSSAELREKTGLTFLKFSLEDMEDPDEQVSEWEYGQEYYILYDPGSCRRKVYDQKLLKAFWGIQELQKKHYLSWETAKKINKTNYERISSLMKLQEEAFSEVGERYFCDFDSQVYYRLLHNLLWSGVDEGNIDSYLRIFMHHQPLTFSEIDRDDTFMRQDDATLYVPKDGRKSDSVLSSVYEKYLKAKYIRESRDLYDEELELREDGYYYHNDIRIEHIVFLCDNFEHGTAAKRMLAAYLKLDPTGDSEEEEKERIRIKNARRLQQQYYLTRSDESDTESTEDREQKVRLQVSLKDVVEKNNCTVAVYGYYGTKEGCRKIDAFLEMHGISFLPSNFAEEITRCAVQIQNDVKKVWPGVSCGDYYTVIREFNMTKVNVFPKNMVTEPRRAICMFVQKKELTASQS